MQQIVELSQKQKLKKFNDKLQLMMKAKSIDKNKLGNLNLIKLQKDQKEIQIEKNNTKIEKNNTKKEKVQHSEKVEKVQSIANNNHQNNQQQSEENQNNEIIQKGKIIKKDKQARMKEKLKTKVTLRKAAGQVWKDKTLEQWPQNDYRIFVGNLGNQVTDQMLAAVFRNKYSSFQMAKLVMDKRTGKTKGYGFVSLKDPKDFLNALKEMNNKYIGNRPVKVTKSNWKDRSLDSDKNKQLPSDFSAVSGKQTNKICLNFKYVSPF